MKYINARILDKINEYYTTGEIVATNFLDPSELVEVRSTLNQVENVAFGGYENAERKAIIIRSGWRIWWFFKIYFGY